MATDAEIQKFVQHHHGFIPKTVMGKDPPSRDESRVSSTCAAGRTTSNPSGTESPTKT